MVSSARPGIYQIGHVDIAPDGTTMVSGWGLTTCAAHCPCHRHPVTGQLSIAPDTRGEGRLGIASYPRTSASAQPPWGPAQERSTTPPEGSAAAAPLLGSAAATPLESSAPPQDQAQGPSACSCCQPWTCEELTLILRDLAQLAALQHPRAQPLID